MNKKLLRNLAVIIAISIVITFVFDFSFGGIDGNLKDTLLNITYGVIIGITISASGFIARFIRKKSDIKNKPVATYVWLLIAVSFYIIIDVFTINILWYHFVGGYSYSEIINSNGLIITSIITILIGLIIFFIILSKIYFKRLLDTKKEVEEIKQKAEKSKFETLQAQINPHFLFNSLNTLSSLIQIDTDKADEFTNKLSSIYRYVLDHQNDELTTVKNEIEFIEKYIYLQKIRFDNNFLFTIDDYAEYADMLIIPLSLQIIIENIFKHNIISNDTKIKIYINFKKNYIIVQNNKNLKKETEISHNVGLNNIIDRYKLISEQECIIENTETDFIVKLPLINSF